MVMVTWWTSAFVKSTHTNKTASFSFNEHRNDKFGSLDPLMRSISLAIETLSNSIHWEEEKVHSNQIVIGPFTPDLKRAC